MILVIALGKFNSGCCWYDSAAKAATRTTAALRAAATELEACVAAARRWGREVVDRLQLLNAREDIVVSDVLLNTGHGRITIFGLPDTPGHCSRVFEAVASAGVMVDIIVQNLNLNLGRAELSFSVPKADLTRTLIRAQDVTRAMAGPPKVVGETDIAVLFVLGVGMRTHTGVARRMFGALAEKGINIALINTSEVYVSVVVERARGEEALACLRAAFLVK